MSNTIDSFWLCKSVSRTRLFRRITYSDDNTKVSFDEFTGGFWISYGRSLNEWIDKQHVNGFFSLISFGDALEHCQADRMYEPATRSAEPSTSTTQETTETKERKDNSMVWNIAVTRSASEVEKQNGKGETMVVPTDNFIVANQQNTALILFGAKHSKEIMESGASPDLMVVHVRQGV